MSAINNFNFFYQIIITFVSVIFWMANPSKYYYVIARLPTLTSAGHRWMVPTSRGHF